MADEEAKRPAEGQKRMKGHDGKPSNPPEKPQMSQNSSGAK
jgi:hypothetical protein